MQEIQLFYNNQYIQGYKKIFQNISLIIHPQASYQRYQQNNVYKDDPIEVFDKENNLIGHMQVGYYHTMQAQENSTFKFHFSFSPVEGYENSTFNQTIEQINQKIINIDQKYKDLYSFKFVKNMQTYKNQNNNDIVQRMIKSLKYYFDNKNDIAQQLKDFNKDSQNIITQINQLFKEHTFFTNLYDIVYDIENIKSYNFSMNSKEVVKRAQITFAQIQKTDEKLSQGEKDFLKFIINNDISPNDCIKNLAQTNSEEENFSYIIYNPTGDNFLADNKYNMSPVISQALSFATADLAEKVAKRKFNDYIILKTVVKFDSVARNPQNLTGPKLQNILISKEKRTLDKDLSEILNLEENKPPQTKPKINKI